MSFNLEDFVKKPFALEHFKAFLIELFGEKITFTKPNFKGLDYENSLIRSYCSLCENIRLNSDELGIFIFTVSSIKAKITLHNELKKILKTSSASAILAIFHEENNNEFRLSLITSGFDYEANKITFSDLKRQSFILGTSRTATSYKALQELLAKKEELTLNLLKERFSQEPLTKEFFDEYKKQFDFIFKALQKANLCNVFADYKGISDTLKAYKAFANKLLGRIVFLYFLQKKFWLGVSKDKAYGDGEADFLHKLFKKAQEKNENFYEKYLCPLFFDSLNLQREDDYMPLFESKIPFLNGSLFEDEFIKNANEKPHFLIAQILDNDFFEKLFRFFDRYNFTLEESSPKEVEIAIDPEMLGRIFEAMMDDNKEKGAFYTPREIVHYMAKNALLLHFSKIFPANEKELKALIFNSQSDNDFVRKNAKMIKDELLQLSILDPACGSGAFPMGLLSEMISILESLDKTLESKDKADLKRRIISKCIYGIDIDAGAIEIAKLRFYLSIAVDEEAPKPLPNLDFKFMQGNALISTICGREIIPNSNENKPARKIQKDLFGNADIKELDKISLFDETRADKIKMLFNAYFSQNDLAEKRKLKFEILSQMKEVFDERIKELDTHIKALKTSITKIGLHVSTDTKSKQEKDLKEFAEYENFKNELLALLDDYKKQDFHSEKLFLYEFFFADIMQSGGFDIVIGNPPYGAKIGEAQKKIYKSLYKYTIYGSLDTYKLFIERGFNLLKQNGNLNYIVPISVTSSKSNASLHKMILENCEFVKVSSYSNAPARIFYNADQRVSIIGFLKTNTKCKELLTTRINKRYSSQSIDSVIQNLSFVNSINFVQPEAFCKIGLPIEKSIMQKLYSQKQTLKDLMGGKQKVYYRDTGGRYYDLYTSYSTTKSTTEKSFEIKNSKSIVALMSSTLFYWFRIAYTEGRHSYIYQFERFPIPNLSKEIFGELEKLGAEYEKDIEKNHDYSNGVKTYKIRKSKHIIDKIDRLICPLYGLSEEETEFIIGYELEFRVDDEGK